MIIIDSDELTKFHVYFMAKLIQIFVYNFILATTLCSLVLESTSTTAAAPKLSNLLFILYNVDKYLMNVFAFCSKLNDLKRHFVFFTK